MLPLSSRWPAVILTTIVAAVMCGASWYETAGDDLKWTAPKTAAKTPPNVAREVEPAAALLPDAPRSVIRIGATKKSGQPDAAVLPEDGGLSATPAAKSPPAAAAPAAAKSPPDEVDTPSETAGAPGRIEPHNPRPVTKDAKRLVQQAYQLSGSAEREKDFTQILNLCQQAAALTEDDEVVVYLNRLAAWAYDHRGQLVSEEASELAVSGKLTEAREFEQRALTDFDRAVHLDPTRWRAVHNRGVSYALFGKDKYAAALKDFDRTIELEPKFYKAWFDRAEIRRELGRYDQAVEDYAQALRLKPNDALAHRGHAHARYQLGQLPQALDGFSRVVKLTPKDAIAWVDRADLFAELNRWEAAAQDYQQALKVDKETGRAYLGCAWLMATCPDARIRNPDFSVKAAEKAIELDGVKDHPHYLDTLAAAYASAGMFREAKAAAAQALENAPAGARAAVKNRLALYQQEQPYQQSVGAVRPAAGP